MKVLDLRCARGHGFEGWFASGEAFETQHTAGLVECPVCGDTDVAKLLSAPRLNLSGARNPSAAAAPTPAESERARESGVELARHVDSPGEHWLRAVREVMARTEDVGERFPDEARKIHYGEVPERSIRGRATRVEAEALVDEGIEVMPLQLPHALKQTLQ